MRRKILVAFLAIVAVAIIAAVAVVLSLGRIVEAGVESAGRSALNVDTSLDEASVSLWRGKVSLDGLTLGSPEGYQEPQMFSADTVRVDMQVLSVLQDEVVVEEIVVDAPLVTLEIRGANTNWNAVMAGLQKAPPDREAKAGRKVRVNMITISNGKLRISGAPILGSAELPLPTVQVRELRTADGAGVTAKKLTATVVSALYEAILEAAKDKLPAADVRKMVDQFTALLQEGAGEKTSSALEEKAKDLLKDLTGIPQPEQGRKRE